MESKTVIIGKKEYVVTTKKIPHRMLQFFIDNPRVYSLFDRSEKEPTQIEMEQMLRKQEDVKELKITIEKNGGLITPIIVRDGDYTVIEGNRRLASYRMLAESDPDKWDEVPCEVYSADLDEDAIFHLLGQLHINGQKSWAPFEEAGYIYRYIEKTNGKFENIADELGKQKSTIEKLYSTYKYMIDHDDQESSHWSYYEELLKNTAIRKASESLPELEARVVSEIKGGVIADAKKDIREKLGKIAKDPDVGKTLLKEYVSGEKSLQECANEIADKDVDLFHKVQKFRKDVSSIKTVQLKKIPEDEIGKYVDELKIIKKRVDTLLEELNREE